MSRLLVHLKSPSTVLQLRRNQGITGTKDGEGAGFLEPFPKVFGSLSRISGNEGQKTVACSPRDFSQGILSRSKPRWEVDTLKFSLSRTVVLNFGCTLEITWQIKNTDTWGPPPRDSDLTSPGIRILFFKIILGSQIIDPSHPLP